MAEQNLKIRVDVETAGVRELSSAIEVLQQQIAAVKAKLETTATGSPEYKALEKEYETLSGQATTLTSRLETLDLSF